MKKFNKIIMSDVEPDINCIWLNNKTLLAYKNGKWVPILRGEKSEEEKLPTYYIKGVVAEEYRNLNPDDWWKFVAPELGIEANTEEEFDIAMDTLIEQIIINQGIESEEEKETYRQRLHAEINGLEEAYRQAMQTNYYLEDGSLKKLDIKKDGSFIVNLEGRENIIPFAYNTNFLQEITASSLPKIENLSEFLRDYKNLQKAKLDLSEVTKYCNQLFYNCTSLEKVELNAPNVTSAEDMLYDSQNLIYAKINMPKLEVANRMFYKCLNITNILDTPNIESARQMYFNSRIEEVTATYDKLIDAYCMFQECPVLVSAKINLPRVTNADCLFIRCALLNSVELDMPEATNIEYIVYECTSLIKITLNIPKITRLNNAFEGCSSLRFIDLSSITNPEIIKNYSSCFNGVKNCTVKCTQAFKDFCLANKNDMVLDDSVTFDIID